MTPHIPLIPLAKVPGGVDRIGGSRACAEGGEGLKKFSESSAAHEVVFLTFDPFHGPNAYACHTGEVTQKDDVIYRFHKCTEGFRFRKELFGNEKGLASLLFGKDAFGG